MISSDFKEKRSGRIELKTFSYIAVENMVRFLYGWDLWTSPCENPADSPCGLCVETLLEIAEMGALYSIEGLKEDALAKAFDTFDGFDESF